MVVGVTGPPGAGKSTFTDALIHHLRASDKRVAVLAVDPSSPFTGGAILGDRIRMQRHHSDQGVFIRSLATRGSLGGLSAATSDLALLFDAAGYDVIIVETVGVGQDEVDVARIADVTAVILMPGMGDDVQAIKAGIMEVADIYILNKADHPGVERLEAEVQFLLSLSKRDDGWATPIVRCISTEGTGIEDAWAAIERFTAGSHGAHKKLESWKWRLREMLRDRVLSLVDEHALERDAADVSERKVDPYTVVERWMQKLRVN